MKTVEPKRALCVLLMTEEYKVEKEMPVLGVWDVEREKSNGSRPVEFEIVARDLWGTEKAVKRFAQEAFGWGAFSNWRLIPSKTNMVGLVDVQRLLSEVGLPQEPISDE